MRRSYLSLLILSCLSVFCSNDKPEKKDVIYCAYRGLNKRDKPNQCIKIKVASHLDQAVFCPHPWEEVGLCHEKEYNIDCGKMDKKTKNGKIIELHIKMQEDSSTKFDETNKKQLCEVFVSSLGD